MRTRDLQLPEFLPAERKLANDSRTHSTNQTASTN